MRPLRLAFAIPVGLLALLVAAPAWACGGLVNANGSVTLVRTTTMEEGTCRGIRFPACCSRCS